MPDYTVKADVDSMLRADNDAGIRTAIGLGQTDAPTFLGVNINASGATPESGMAWSGSNHLAFFHNSAIRMVVLSTGTTIGSDMAYSWGSAGIPTSASRDLILARDAAGILAQRNGTAAQAFRVYNTYPGTTANEWFEIDWKTSANVARIGTAHAGTGGSRGMEINAGAYINLNVGGVTKFGIGGSQNICHQPLVFNGDNLHDIGASGANRPRNIYVGSDVNLGITGSLIWSSRGSIQPQSSGVFLWRDSAATDFGRLQLGGTTSAFPAIKRQGAGLDIRLADDTAFAPVRGKLTTDTAFVSGAAAATGYLTLFDSNNVAYRVWCTPA